METNHMGWLERPTDSTSDGPFSTLFKSGFGSHVGRRLCRKSDNFQFDSITGDFCRDWSNLCTWTYFSNVYWKGNCHWRRNCHCARIQNKRRSRKGHEKDSEGSQRQIQRSMKVAGESSAEGIYKQVWGENWASRWIDIFVLLDFYDGL